MFNNLLHYLKLTLITGLLAGMSYSAYAAPVITPKIVPPPKPDPLVVLTDKVNLLQTTVTSLQEVNTKLTTDVNNLKSTVSSLQSGVIVGLGDVMTYDSAKKSVLFTGVDVNIVNGMGYTYGVNGKGNLIVGYNEPASGNRKLYCSDGQFTTEQTCIDNGKSWQLNNRNGSHNIILGYGNDYTNYGGIVAGQDNVINRALASVLAGTGNIASGYYSSVLAGYNNTASGNNSSVSGGYNNTASGSSSSVSGGRSNTASNDSSSVSGGSNNTASSSSSSVSGGFGNTASSSYSSVSGGQNNTASGSSSSVSGGSGVTMPNDNGWAAGGLIQ